MTDYEVIVSQTGGLMFAGGIVFGVLIVWLLDEWWWKLHVASWARTAYQRKVNAWFREQDKKHGVVVPKYPTFRPELNANGVIDKSCGGVWTQKQIDEMKRRGYKIYGAVKGD